MEGGKDQGWLDDERESKDPRKLERNCDHSPIQSVLYNVHKSLLEDVQMLLVAIITIAIILLVFLTNWINIEEGRFPFNVSFVADMAYSKHKMGTPVAALLMVAFASITIVFGRRFIIGLTENSIYEKMMGYCKENGILRVVKPKAP